MELEQLKDLIVSNSDLCLDLSEPDGVLNDLKSLKRLKSLSIDTRQSYFVNCDWGLAEIAWVRENWPELESVDLVHYKDEVPNEDLSPPFCTTYSTNF